MRYDKLVRGRTVSYHPQGVAIPARCPRGGFPFRAVLHFQDGDTIAIDVAARTLNIEVPADTLKQRLAGWKAPAPRYTTGVLAKYAKLVSSASTGAVTG